MMMSNMPKTAEEYLGLVDHAIIEVTRKVSTQLPFFHMLAAIKETHRYGLDAEG